MQQHLGIKDLRLLSQMQAYGSTPTQMLQYAALSVASGSATAVACVWADAPPSENRGAGASYASAQSQQGWNGLNAASGIAGANTMYALAARRHMDAYGTTNDQLGHIAVAQRAWAQLNPLAQMRTPSTLEDYHQSRWIAEPFHLLDCCLVSNGGIAVIVTSAERAKDMAQPLVHLLGWGQSHPGYKGVHDERFGLVSGAATSGPMAMNMARIELADVDVVDLYDCYTYTALITLEDYGFCEKGEGGAFVASGVLGPKGSLKLNTGGGQLSGYYMWGMTPLSEGSSRHAGMAVTGSQTSTTSYSSAGTAAYSTTTAPSCSARRPTRPVDSRRASMPKIGPVLRDDATAAFFDGTAKHEYLLRKCPQGHCSEPVSTQCTQCTSVDLEWTPQLAVRRWSAGPSCTAG